MDENVQSEISNDTADEIEFENTTDIDAVEKIAVTPNSEETDCEDVARDTEDTAQYSVSEKAENTPFVSVQYNHKNKDLTKEEAVTLIQKGMHTESLRNKLEYLANYYSTDINTLVEQMVSTPENAYRARLEELYGKGSEDVEIGMGIYREKQSNEYKKILAERENSLLEKQNEDKIINVNSRLAEEYLVLKREMPNAPDYKDLPDAVIIEAADGNRDLLSAYLCHLNREKTKIDAAKKAYEAANNASSKSMKSTSSDNKNSQERSFLSGLWSK